VEDLRAPRWPKGTLLPRRDLAAALRQAMDGGLPVRPPWAAIPRGDLRPLGARHAQRSRHLRRADRGAGPPPRPDPLLPPAVLRHLGVPGANFASALPRMTLPAALARRRWCSAGRGGMRDRP
jgi:ATP-dependent helicase/nuclease subunit B